MTKKRKVLQVLLSVFAAIAVAVCGIFAFLGLYGKTYERAADTVYSILQITDVHILNDTKKDAKAFKTITAMVEAAKPDMIMVTGDITSEKENFTAFKTFGDFMESFGLPWGFVFGNHEGLDIEYGPGEVLDPEKIADRQTLSDYLESLDNCIYEAGDEDVDGMGNYYYNVTDENGRVVTTLIMMDSHSWDAENEGYDHFHENQVEWYENTIRSIALEVNGDAEKVVPSLAFFHVPMQEYRTGYDAAKVTGKRLWGWRFEKEGCPAVDDRMFEKMVELGSTKGCFAGHDHMNNYEVEYQGIRLCYGLSCDHNIYVVPLRGGKLIEIKSDGSFTTQALFRHRGFGSITFGKVV